MTPDNREPQANVTHGALSKEVEVSKLQPSPSLDGGTREGVK